MKLKIRKNTLGITMLITSCLTGLMAQNVQAQSCNEKIISSTPTSRFTIETDNTVTDKITGLTWMRCSLGQTGNDCSGGKAKGYTWTAALNEISKNHNGWRMPNIKELASIVELKCQSPAINTTVFPNTVGYSIKYNFFGRYWTSSPYASNDKNAWSVDFNAGHDSDTPKTNYHYVRLVRNSK